VVVDPEIVAGGDLILFISHPLFLPLASSRSLPLPAVKQPSNPGREYMGERHQFHVSVHGGDLAVF